MTRVLLTGAGGFVGHHTLEHLLVNTDWEIVCLDSFRHKGKTSRLREVLDAHAHTPAGRSSFNWPDRVTVLTHDLRVPIDRQLDREIGYVQYVISMASDSHVDRSCVDPRPFIEGNVALVLTLLEWMRDRRAWYSFDPPSKFIHVSTDEVYGPAHGSHLHYEGEPHRPSNPYSASKACQEDIVYSYWRTFNLPVAVTNTMNIIGERQDPEKFVPKVIRAVNRGDTVQIHSGEGNPGSRFYLHARNQADALLFLLKTQPFPRYEAAKIAPSHSTGPTMQRWNVVGEREVDNLEMAQMIAASVGKKLNYELTDFHGSRPGHDLRYALDGLKLHHLGWDPPVPLDDSLHKTVEWTLAHPQWMLD